MTFVNVLFFVFNSVFPNKFSGSSSKNRSAYWVSFWIKIDEQFRQWSLLHVSYCDALTDVNVAKRVDVDSTLVRKVLV